MKQIVSWQSLLFLVLVLTVVEGLGCGADEYSVTVRNRLDVSVTVFIDGDDAGDADPGKELSIEGLRAGAHVLSARADGYTIVEQHISIDRDITWTIRKTV